MIASMTGFGKAVAQLNHKKITVEIKSLNSKGIEINTRIPSTYREKELELRKKVTELLLRGKVDLGIYIETTGVDDSIKINREMVLKYIQELEALQPNSTENLLEIAMRLPEVVSTKKEEIDESEWEIIQKIVAEALQNILEYRNAEGSVLKKDIEQRVYHIGSNLQKIKEIDVERKSEVKLRLRKSLEELKISVDENRFEQEMIYYLEKLDITEETVRLKNHLDYFLQDLNHEVSHGKKMAFITQEIGREINTIGSKANHAPMQKLVIEMKDELEKIKEQTLNIL